MNRVSWGLNFGKNGLRKNINFVRTNFGFSFNDISHGSQNELQFAYVSFVGMKIFYQLFLDLVFHGNTNSLKLATNFNQNKAVANAKKLIWK